MRIVPLVVVMAGLPLAGALAQEPAARFAAPPDGFDALHASDAQRAYYGFPRKPARIGANGGTAYRNWAQAMASARHYVAPAFHMVARRHGPQRPAARRVSPSMLAARSADPMTSTNWTAEILQNGATGFGSGSFNQVMGLWQLPSVQQSAGTCSGTDVSALWVGLDGAAGASNDVLQAGTESDVACFDGTSVRTYYPWFEWYPDYSYQITNFALSGGDSVYVDVQASSATSGQAMFVNLKTGDYTMGPITPPAGTSLTGNTAEWVMERPSLEKNDLGTLADFGVVMMCYELAGVSGVGGFTSPGAPNAGQSVSLVSMVDDNGTTIAETAMMGPTGQAFSVQGPTQ